MNLSGQMRVILIASLGLAVLLVVYFATRPTRRVDRDPNLANVDRAEDGKDIDKLKAMLKNDDPRVVNRSMMALVRLTGRTAEPDIAPLLQDQRPEVRALAAGLYGHTIDRNGAGPLLELLKKEKDASVRAKAASSLGVCDSFDGMPDLIKMLDDTNISVRSSAIEAIRAILGMRVEFNPAGSAVDRRRVQDRLNRDLARFRKSYELRTRGK